MSFSVLFTRQVDLPITQATPEKESNNSSTPVSATQIFFKCICFEGKKAQVHQELNKKKVSIALEDCEEVPANQIGAKIRNFLEIWDTQGFSPLQIQQERQLWRGFFLQPRDNCISINDIQFYRQNSKNQYSIQIGGPAIEDVLDLLKESFADPSENPMQAALDEENKEKFDLAVKNFENVLETQKAQLKENALPIKEKVSICALNTFEAAFSSKKKVNEAFIVDANEKFLTFREKYFGLLTCLMIDARDVYYFALTPTITKVVQALNYGGIGIIHTLEEAK